VPCAGRGGRETHARWILRLPAPAIDRIINKKIKKNKVVTKKKKKQIYIFKRGKIRKKKTKKHFNN
jgi:hypothetical protein